MTLADALMRFPLDTSNINIHDIGVSAAVYAKAAREHADYMRARCTKFSNTRGRVLKVLEVGDCVKIVSPSHS